MSEAPNWYDGLEPDDLPGDLALVAQECGMDVAIRLAEKMGGLQLYIRNVEGLISVRKKQYILDNFTGSNHKELALATGWSLQYVYQVLREHRTAVPSLF